jgi:hypothetical protein
MRLVVLAEVHLLLCLRQFQQLVAVVDLMSVVAQMMVAVALTLPSLAVTVMLAVVLVLVLAVLVVARQDLQAVMVAQALLLQF